MIYVSILFKHCALTAEFANQRDPGKIEASTYARDIQLNLASNVDGAGAKDTIPQILINCSQSLLRHPDIEFTEHLKRLANEYIMARSTALDILKNSELFLLISRVLQFPHHQNMGKPNVNMFTSWGSQIGHGSVCYRVSLMLALPLLTCRSQVMKMILTPELERLRFLMTDTKLPDFDVYVKMDPIADPEVDATRLRVCGQVQAAVCSNTLAPINVTRLPLILCENANVMYLKTMARVAKAPVLELFDVADPDQLAMYTEGLAEFVAAVTKILEDYVTEIPKGPGTEAELEKRKMLLNNHKWMTHGPVCLHIWPAKRMLPYMLRAPVLNLNAMLLKVAPALTEVRVF